MYRRLNTRGQRRVVRYISLKKLHLIAKTNFPPPWDRLYYKIFREVARELLSHTKLRNIDYIRLANAIDVLIQKKKAEFEGKFFDAESIPLEIPTRRIFREMLEMLPVWCSKRKEYEEYHMLGDYVDDKVEKNEHKLLRLFMRAVQEEIRDKRVINSILSKIQEKLRLQQVSIDLENL